MSVTMKAVLAVVALVLAGTFAEARELAQTSTVAYECEHPPSGTWKVEHYLPIGDGKHLLGIRTYLAIEEAYPGIYSGSGGGVILIDGAVPAGTPITYNFLGVFKNDTCTMSGTILNFEAQAADAIAWEYDGDKMEGITANYASGNVSTPYPGRHELTYIE